jgi:cell division protein FtsL
MAPSRSQQIRFLVRERDTRRLRTMGVVLGLVGLLVGGVLIYVWHQVQQVRLAYELEELRALRSELDELNRRLKVEVASLRTLARIEQKARAELGLEVARGDQVQLAREFVPGVEPGSTQTAWEESLAKRPEP